MEGQLVPGKPKSNQFIGPAVDAASKLNGQTECRKTQKSKKNNI